MSVSLHNSLSRSKQPFRPIASSVRIYTCGPTVYSRAHIGNLSSYLFADFLVRWLELQGHTIEHAKNITDVGHLTQDDIDAGDDKMVKAATEQQTSVEAIAQTFTRLYIQDECDLHIREPEHRPKATDYIEEQIAFVQHLIEKDHAYETNGNVYFSIESFPDYGNLSGNTVAALREGVRIEVDPNKRHPADFLLWRNASQDHLMQWPSPWGQGYPGWHIECSAMAAATLGEQIDIHTGGEDNIFPHHESEIAQSESRFNKPFSQFWMHKRHILVNGAKMSKSLRNVYSLDDIRKKDFHPLDFRLLVFSSHYRSKLDFSWDAMKQAKSIAQRLVRTYHRVVEYEAAESLGSLQPFWDRFLQAMNDDLNTPQALAVLIEASKEINAQLDAKEQIEGHAKALLASVDQLLQLFVHYPVETHHSSEIQTLINERAAARAERNYERADQIREQLRTKGVELQDSE